MPWEFDEENINMSDEARKVFEKYTKPKSDKPLPPLKVPPPRPVGEAKLYTMKITLLEIEPPIWRRFVAPTFMKLHHFHACLQEIMGWDDAHAYAFTINGNRFASKDGGFHVDNMWDREDSYDASKYELCQLIKPGMTFQYEYDFGDGWEHEIVVENDTADRTSKHPFYCLEGERACPPEDCGGPRGYESLLETLADPNDPEHDDMTDWLEGVGYDRFDSEFFDPDRSNRGMGVSRPGRERSQKKKVDPKKLKQERKRREAAKKRNRKKK